MCTTSHYEIARGSEPRAEVDAADVLRASDEQAMFNRQLSTYRKVVGANLMFHREVYSLLRDMLRERMQKPFRFLDIACGDATASAAALQTCSIAHYYGIDLSPRSIELASESLKALPCAVELRCGDFVDAMSCWLEPVDVVWIGMSLHHLPLEGKRTMMRFVHRALPEDGLLLIWEPTLLDGEDRAGWLDRFSEYRDTWAALNDEEFSAMEGHMRLADFPESAATWKSLGREAGFANARELFVMPNGVGRVFQYWN